MCFVEPGFEAGLDEMDFVCSQDGLPHFIASPVYCVLEVDEGDDLRIPRRSGRSRIARR